MALQVSSSKDSHYNSFPLSYKDYERSKKAFETFDWIELGRNKYKIYYVYEINSQIVLFAWSIVNNTYKISKDALILQTREEVLEKLNAGRLQDVDYDVLYLNNGYYVRNDYLDNIVIINEEWIKNQENQEFSRIQESLIRISNKAAAKKLYKQHKLRNNTFNIN